MVKGKLHLPPGWKLLDAGGVDNVRQTWLKRWTLLDFFLVLIFTIAVAKLFSLPMAALSFITLVLIFHEPGAPRYIWLALLVGCTPRARALDSEEREFDGQRFHVVSIDLTRQSLSLHWRNPDDGQAYGSIDALQQWGTRHGKRLLFAANAGIYDHKERKIRENGYEWARERMAQAMKEIEEADGDFLSVAKKYEDPKGTYRTADFDYLNRNDLRMSFGTVGISVFENIGNQFVDDQSAGNGPGQLQFDILGNMDVKLYI